MSYGLRVWDPFNRLTVDTTRRLKMHHMDVFIPSLQYNQQVWVPVPGMTNTNEWMVVVHSFGFIGMSVILPVLSNGGFWARAEGFYNAAASLASIYRG